MGGGAGAFTEDDPEGLLADEAVGGEPAGDGGYWDDADDAFVDAEDGVDMNDGDGA